MNSIEIRPNVSVEDNTVKTGYTITETKRKWGILGPEVTEVKDVSFGEFNSPETAIQKARRSQLLNGVGATLSIGAGACLAVGSFIGAAAQDFDFHRFATEPLSPGVFALAGFWLFSEGLGFDKRAEGSLKIRQRLKEIINRSSDNPSTGGGIISSL